MATAEAKQRSPELIGELPKVESANVRLLAEVRLSLVLVALLMVLLEPPGPARGILGTVLLAYGMYGYLRLRQLNRHGADSHLRISHWIDLACYALAVAFSGGLASAFFVFLLFPILVASFLWGFRKGVMVALACTLLFLATGASQTWLAPGFQWEQFPLGPVAVLFLAGLVVARWGRSEAMLMRRLAFSNDLNHVFSPRHGVDHVMYGLAEMLRAYQRADACIVLITDSKSGACLLYEVSEGARKRNEHAQGERIGRDVVEPLLAMPSDHAVLYSRRFWPWGRAGGSAYDLSSLEPQPVDQAALAELANFLETDSFVSLPVRVRNRTLGRFFLSSRRLRYTRSDVRFLVQVVGQAALVIENVQLVDRLALEVATEERKKISRDLHDGTIQPYIGLKLGLEALRRRLEPGNPVAVEVDDLAKMAGDGISQLRCYVGSLRNGEQKTGHDSLLSAVRRQAGKFSEFYGIDVQVEADGDIVVRGPLFEEVMHIVREGLSNIRRHTSAERVAISLRDDHGQLVVEFVNDNSNCHNGSAEFFPRSISERARELGGRVDVEQRPGSCTAVTVQIPF